MFGPAQSVKPGALAAPDCAWIHNELKRHRHVTLQLLWEEYAERYDAAAYRRSCSSTTPGERCRSTAAAAYVYAEWKECTVAFDYHVDVDRHYYSVPHALVGHSVRARFTATTVEAYFRGERVASHVRSYQRGAHTTLPEGPG